METRKGAKPIRGVKLSAARAQVYADVNRDDLLIVAFEPNSVGAAVTTQNRFCAAPVHRLREHLVAADKIRYWLLNAGNANAGNGIAGLVDCDATLKALADASGCQINEIWPFSTGVIGEPLPVQKIISAIPVALGSLKSNKAAWMSAAEAIMTTDTYPKLRHITTELEGVPISITGIAKGSGMIHPNMATMFGLIATDANITSECLQIMLSRAVSHSFNCVTIDGDTSTNDACAIVATRQANHSLITDVDSSAGQIVQKALSVICNDLAELLARDGEGASKFVRVICENAANNEDAHLVANAIALSPLIKTALAASDPNWGRILAAVGRAPLKEINISSIDIWVNRIQIVSCGERHSDYTEERGQAAMEPTDIDIRVSLGQGDGYARLMTCDLTKEYIRINADYRS